MAEPLSPAARAFRAGHAVIAAGFLAAIADVWASALTGRRGPLLHASVAALVAEGVVVAANGGDCPLGGLQDRMGDPVPLFELVLPRAPRAWRSRRSGPSPPSGSCSSRAAARREGSSRS